MLKKTYFRKVSPLILVVIIIFFSKSVVLQNIYGQQIKSSIDNVDKALQYYINKFTPPPYPKRGATINSRKEIIMKNSVIDDDLKYLVFFNELKELYIIKSKKVTDEGMEYLKDLTNIELLTLWGTNVSIKGLEKLSKLKNIKILGLADTRIIDEDLKNIADIFTNLETLDISENKIKGHGISYLKNLKKLKVISLNNTLISDATVKYFAGFENCEISLHNTKVTQKGKEEILRITKNCSVSIKEGDLAPPKE